MSGHAGSPVRSALSYLYVPGDGRERLAAAHTRGADAVIADLEDSVAPVAKDAARELVAAWVAGAGERAGETWVRIDAGEPGERDLAAVVGPGLTGVCLPKVDAADEVARVDALLTRLEGAAGLPEGRIVVCPMIESATGLVAVATIARAPRVRMLQIGEVDLAADLGLEVDDGESPLLHARSAVVVASAAAGVRPPIAAVSTQFTDVDRFRSSTRRLRGLGFRGRACIHPAQVSVVHEVFRPTAAELAGARALVERYDEALAAGRGVVVDEHGRMVDEAAVRAARALLDD